MTVDLLERALAGAIPTAPAPDEAAYLAVWRAAGLGAGDPIANALHGGLLADRLPWVFIAGYQAANRRIFPDLPAEDWVAYAAAEDRDNPDLRPGVTARQADGGWRLDGSKTWIGQSRSVARLIVTARVDGADQPNATAMVERSAAGLTLTHREAPGFLPALSQGFAAFDAAACTAPTPWTPPMVKRFGRLEARFVMLAAAGFLLNHGAPPAVMAPMVLALAESCETEDIGPLTMAAIDDAFQVACADFEAKADLASLPDWAADRRLLGMYSARIQKRAQYAR